MISDQGQAGDSLPLELDERVAQSIQRQVLMRSASGSGSVPAGSQATTTGEVVWVSKLSVWFVVRRQGSVEEGRTRTLPDVKMANVDWPGPSEFQPHAAQPRQEVG